MHKTTKKKFEESRAAESITVFWMLSMLATLGADVFALAGWVWLSLFSSTPGSVSALQSIPKFLLTSASITGLICLLIIPLVYKLRQSPPPKAITVFTVLISIAPVLLLVLRWLLSSD